MNLRDPYTLIKVRRKVRKATEAASRALSGANERGVFLRDFEVIYPESIGPTVAYRVDPIVVAAERHEAQDLAWSYCDSDINRVPFCATPVTARV